MNPDNVMAGKAALNMSVGRMPMGPSNVVSMAILFGAVKRKVQAQQAMEQSAMASRAEGQRASVQEHSARERNLDRMRQQTKSQLALSMGVDPFMMSGSTGPGDPTTAAYITRAASSQQMKGLGMV